MLHWLKGHKWEIVATSCDFKEHFMSSSPSGYYLVTHVLLRCKECGKFKQGHFRGSFEIKEQDTLAEALKYLEK